MNTSLSLRIALACTCVGLAAQPACAAGPGAPTTYTLTRPAASTDDMNVSIYRDGARETIKMSRANGWHMQEWFDFAQHKQYATDSNAPGQCSVIAYTSDGPPELLDPVAGASGMASQIPANVPGAGKETLGGIDTRIIALPGGGKAWIDDAHHLAIKVQVVMENNPAPQTMVDLTGIRFDKPDPALLVPPTGCRQLSGSANAHGGHAEVPVHS